MSDFPDSVMLGPSDYGFNPFFTSSMFGGRGQPDQINLEALGSYQLQYQPISNPQLSSNLGYSPAPFGGPMAPLLGQLGGMAINQWASSQGYMGGNPFGSFPGNNAVRNRQEMAMAAAAANAADASQRSISRQRWQSMMTGVTRLQADPGTSEAEIQSLGQATGEKFANVFTNPALTPVLATAGQALGVDLVSSLDPQRALTAGLARAGLSTYRGHGQFGMDVGEISAQSLELGNYFFPHGTADTQKTRGFTGGQIGNMMVSLQRNHLLPGMLGEDDVDSHQLEETAKDFKGDKAAALANINAGVVKGKLTEYTKVFQMAKEITGSDDMDQLMGAIQALTGGGASKMTASQLENQMGRLQELARTARISMDQMMFLVQEGSRLGERNGIGGIAGASVATNSIEQSAIMGATLQRATGGEPGVFNLSESERNSESFKINMEASTSYMTRRMAGTVGALDQINRREDGRVEQVQADLEAKQQAGTLDEQGTKDLHLLQLTKRASEGKALAPDDIKLFTTQDGQAKYVDMMIRQGLAMDSQSAMLALNSEVNIRDAMTEHPEINTTTVKSEAAINKALVVNDRLIGMTLPSGQVIDRKQAEAIADLHFDAIEGTADYRRKAEALKQQYPELAKPGVLSSVLADVQSQQENQLLAQTPARMVMQKLQAMSEKDNEEFRKSISENTVLHEAINKQLGGAAEPFMERLTDALAGFNTNPNQTSQEALLKLAGATPISSGMVKAAQPYMQEMQSIQARLKTYSDAEAKLADPHVTLTDTERTELKRITDEGRAVSPDLLVRQHDLSHMVSNQFGMDPAKIEQAQKDLDEDDAHAKAKADERAKHPPVETPALTPEQRLAASGHRRDPVLDRRMISVGPDGTVHDVLGTDQTGLPVLADAVTDPGPLTDKAVLVYDSPGQSHDYDREKDFHGHIEPLRSAAELKAKAAQVKTTTTATRAPLAVTVQGSRIRKIDSFKSDGSPDKLSDLSISVDELQDTDLIVPKDAQGQYYRDSKGYVAAPTAFTESQRRTAHEQVYNSVRKQKDTAAAAPPQTTPAREPITVVVDGVHVRKVDSFNDDGSPKHTSELPIDTQALTPADRIVRKDETGQLYKDAKGKVLAAAPLDDVNRHAMDSQVRHAVAHPSEVYGPQLQAQNGEPTATQPHRPAEVQGPQPLPKATEPAAPPYVTSPFGPQPLRKPAAATTRPTEAAATSPTDKATELTAPPAGDVVRSAEQASLTKDEPTQKRTSTDVVKVEVINPQGSDKIQGTLQLVFEDHSIGKGILEAGKLQQPGVTSPGRSFSQEGNHNG
jgi:hypothetical protein